MLSRTPAISQEFSMALLRDINCSLNVKQNTGDMQRVIYSLGS